jgi:hypothetical protein
MVSRAAAREGELDQDLPTWRTGATRADEILGKDNAAGRASCMSLCTR